jgi:tubulin---tyrosine ligase
MIHNHMPGNGLLGNKKAMFYCLREYYNLMQENVFDVVPLTFIVNHGLLDP